MIKEGVVETDECNPRLFKKYNFSFYAEAPFQENPPTISKSQNGVMTINISVFHTWSKFNIRGVSYQALLKDVNFNISWLSQVPK